MVTPAKLTVSDVAREFGVTPATVRRWADQGDLKHTRTIGGARRFDPDDVQRALEAHT